MKKEILPAWYVGYGLHTGTYRIYWHSREHGYDKGRSTVREHITDSGRLIRGKDNAACHAWMMNEEIREILPDSVRAPVAVIHKEGN